MRSLERGFAEKHAIVRDDADRVTVNPGESGDQRRTVFGLELCERTAVDDAADDLVHVVGHPGVDRNDVVQLALVRGRIHRGPHIPRGRRPRSQGGDDPAHDPQRIPIVCGQVVDDAGGPGVQVSPAEFLGGDLLAGGGFHQWRTAEEDRALIADDDGLVAHRGNVGTTGGAGSQHRRDLRNARGAEPGLVVEDPAEVLPVGEHLVLLGQESPTRVHQIDARKPVLAGDLLGA